jgi:hypothetical protein
MVINGESMAKKRSSTLISQGTTIGALTNMIKVAKQQNKYKKFKKNHFFTKQPTMAITLVESYKTLRS